MTLAINIGRKSLLEYKRKYLQYIECVSTIIANKLKLSLVFQLTIVDIHFTIYAYIKISFIDFNFQNPEL